MDCDVKSILRLIEKHSGEWSWYQLEHSTAGVKLAIKGTRLPAVLDGLIATGYIEEVESSPSTRYAITDLGRAAIAAGEE